MAVASPVGSLLATQTQSWPSLPLQLPARPTPTAGAELSSTPQCSSCSSCMPAVRCGVGESWQEVATRGAGRAAPKAADLQETAGN